MQFLWRKILFVCLCLCALTADASLEKNEPWTQATIREFFDKRRGLQAELQTSLECIKYVAGSPGWFNRENQAFYNWLLRHAPFILESQRDYCGVNECNDLNFLLEFFTPEFEGVSNTRLVPDELRQEKGNEWEPRNVLIVGAHPREVDWMIKNAHPQSQIFAIDHAEMAVEQLKQAATERKWPLERVKIEQISFLARNLRRKLAAMNGGTFPEIHFVFALWSAFFEFNPGEQLQFLNRAYRLLPDIGGLIVDFPSNPMDAAESPGHRRVYIDLDDMGLDDKQMRRIRAVEDPPSLNVYIPNRKEFLAMVTKARFANHMSYQQNTTELGYYLYNVDKQPRALFLFEKALRRAQRRTPRTPRIAPGPN